MCSGTEETLDAGCQQPHRTRGPWLRDGAKCPWRVTLTRPGGGVSLACSIWKGQQAGGECSGFPGPVSTRRGRGREVGRASLVILFGEKQSSSPPHPPILRLPPPPCSFCLLGFVNGVKIWHDGQWPQVRGPGKQNVSPVLMRSHSLEHGLNRSSLRTWNHFSAWPGAGRTGFPSLPRVQDGWLWNCVRTGGSMRHTGRLQGLGSHVRVNKAIGVFNVPQLPRPACKDHRCDACGQTITKEFPPPTAQRRGI